MTEANVDDEIIFDLFLDAVPAFPAHLQDQAYEWLSKREAAHALIEELQEKGAVALLPILPSGDA